MSVCNLCVLQAQCVCHFFFPLHGKDFMASRVFLFSDRLYSTSPLHKFRVLSPSFPARRKCQCLTPCPVISCNGDVNGYFTSQTTAWPNVTAVSARTIRVCDFIRLECSDFYL